MKKWICLCLVLFPFSASGMNFTVTEWRGHQVLKAHGPIISGDADKFANKLTLVSAAPHGVRIVLLNSPGGSVSEAFLMSKFLDRMPAHMVIPNGSRCGSACASILFIAGKYRTVEDSGLFGQHSCSINGVKNQRCNEDISEHAISKGVSYGSIAAFMNYAPPKDMVSFSRTDVDCWGLSRYPFSHSSNFGKSEPCIYASLNKPKPPAQSAWRVDFFGNGYSAFLRPVSDDQRELQLNIWCHEKHRGNLFLSIEIGGSTSAIKGAITRAEILAKPVMLKDVRFNVFPADTRFSRMVFAIPKHHVRNFLTRSDNIFIRLETRSPYEPIEVKTRLKGSRKALIFAANNCMK